MPPNVGITGPGTTGTTFKVPLRSRDSNTYRENADRPSIAFSQQVLEELIKLGYLKGKTESDEN